jgi:probable HAF family extracellular repeat protein
MTELRGYGGDTIPSDVNEAGDIVGTSARPGEWDAHAVLWHRGRMTALGDLGGGISVATGIDDDGTVVGYGTTATGEVHAFSWRRGVMTDLAPDTRGSYAEAVAAGRTAGTVAGDGSSAVVVWRRGVRHVLRGFDPDTVTDVNRRGDVLGGTPMSGSLVRWSNGRTTSIETPAGQDELAMQAVSDRRVVAGYSDHWTPDLVVSYHAWVWRNGSLTELPDLVGQSRALDVDEHGTVAGDSAVAGTWGNTHAVVWVR